MRGHRDAPRTRAGEAYWQVPELRRLVPSAHRATFLRELFDLHAMALALLCWYSPAHPHQAGQARQGLDARGRHAPAEPDARRSGKADDDLLFGLEIEPDEVVLSAAEVVDFEAAMEADFDCALALMKASATDPMAQKAFSVAVLGTAAPLGGVTRLRT